MTYQHSLGQRVVEHRGVLKAEIVMLHKNVTIWNTDSLDDMMWNTGQNTPLNLGSAEEILPEFQHLKRVVKGLASGGHENFLD